MVTCDLPDMYDLRPAGIHTALKPVGIYIYIYQVNPSYPCYILTQQLASTVLPTVR